MQKWEYCIVGPVKLTGGDYVGQYPKVGYFNSQGMKVFDIEGPATTKAEKAAKIQATISALGDAGWEMTGTAQHYIGESRTVHWLYFKRPKE